jgi:hypothetical protein
LCLGSISIIGLIGLFRFRKLSPALKFIEWFILSSLVSGWFENYLAAHNIRNLWLFHFNMMLELGLLLMAFYHWRINTLQGKIIRWSFGFYLLCWIVGVFTFEPLSQSDKYTSILAKLIQIGMSIWLMLNIVKDTSVHWKYDSRIWVASGLLIYNSSTLLYFGLFGVLLMQYRELLIILIYINWYAIIISYIFFLRAFFCQPASAGINHQSQITHKENLT